MGVEESHHTGWLYMAGVQVEGAQASPPAFKALWQVVAFTK